MKESKIIIKTENLTKRYNGNVAVNNLNLEVEEGEIFGLLGPNGAGKTTTILMLIGLTEPSEGKAFIYGHDCTRNPVTVKRMVGYLPDKVGFYEDMTGRENLRHTGRLNGMDEELIEERIESLAARVGLVDAIENKVGTYSRGMRQRLGIADVLMKDPKVVIFDEPTLGIDPEGMRELLQLIIELSRKDGRTVLVSSHQLHQVQQICDRVGIFVGGSLLASGPIETLGEQVFKDQHQILEIKACPDDQQLKDIIQNTEGVLDVKYDNGMYTIISTSDVRSVLVKTMINNNYSLLHLKMHGRDLDEIYSRYFAGEEVRA
jgi:ABC-2 type transport system ATP-binding protein